MILLQRCWVCGAPAEYEEAPWPGETEKLYVCKDHHG